MFLLLAIVSLGGILTAWGITRLPLGPPGSAQRSLGRFTAYGLSLVFGLVAVSGFFAVSFREPPQTSDSFVAWASHFLLICTFFSLSLLLYAIWQARGTEQGIASIAAGIILVGFASFPLFHPALIYPIFRSVFIITPSELLVCVLFYLVGMSFVLGQRFWAAIRTFFSPYLHEHPFYTGIVASMLLVTIVVLATMPPFLTSWVNRMRGFKTPLLEAQFSSLRDSNRRPVAFREKVNNWPNILLVETDIAGLISSLSKLELDLGKTSDLTESMQRLDSHLRSIGFYDYLETLEEPSTRPHLSEMKRRTGCWAMRLYYRKDYCGTTQEGKEPMRPTQEVQNESPSTQKMKKQASSKLPLSKRGETDMLYEKNPVFYGTVAFLFQFSEDFKNAELVLEAGLQHAERNNGLHWIGAKAYLNYWLGSFIYNRYHELQIEEADTRALELFRQAIGNTTIVTEAISMDGTADPKTRREWIDDWKSVAFDAKTSYVLVAADSLLNEWSARRYAADIMDARGYLVSHPLSLESVGWAQIRFHKDEQEIRDGKAILVELERVMEADKTDKFFRWKVLKTIRNHIAEADLLLETG